MMEEGIESVNVTAVRESLPLATLERQSRSTQAKLLSCFKTRGYCLVTLDEDQKHHVSQCRNLMKDILGGHSVVTRNQLLHTKQLVEGIGLVGYNEPCPSKVVFRVRRGITEQQFPCTEMFKSARKAHDILEHVVKTILQQLLCDKAMDILSNVADIGEQPELQFSASPFDFFLYSNSAEIKQPNCAVHVDPGLLTAVPCANIPGLCVLQQDNSWICVEETPCVPNLHVAVFCGQYLSELLGGQIRAATHCVVKSTDQSPRLSLVYEVRPRPSKACVPVVPLHQ